MKMQKLNKATAIVMAAKPTAIVSQWPVNILDVIGPTDTHVEVERSYHLIALKNNGNENYL